MEGSDAYARGHLKSDLRNARTLLALLDGDALRQLEGVVHDVTVGLRERCPADLDVDALRRSVEAEAAEAARAARVAEDTLRHLARSLERVLPWWQALPAIETVLDEDRWGEAPPGARTLDLTLRPDEQFRVLGLPRTRDLIRARFEKYLSKHPGIEALRLLGEDGQPVFTLVADAGVVRLAG
jgi:hypothetical protein